MATAPRLDPETEQLIDDLIAGGRFTERADVLRYGVRLILDEEGLDEPLDAETLVMLEERIAEAEADPGGGIPAEEVFAEMERLCLEEIDRRQRASQ